MLGNFRRCGFESSGDLESAICLADEVSITVRQAVQRPTEARLFPAVPTAMITGSDNRSRCAFRPVTSNEAHGRYRRSYCEMSGKGKVESASFCGRS